VYALLTVVWNTAGQISSNLSAILITAFGITLTNFENLWKLVLTTSLLGLIPILFIPLTPARPGLPKVIVRSKLGGGICLGVVFAGLIFSVVDAIVRLSLAHPEAATTF